MKAVRIFLLILIVIGLGLIAAQSLWVPTVVNTILQYQGEPPQTVATTTALKSPSITAAQTQKAAPIQKKTIIETATQFSSSTTQVGDFTIVVDCKNNNPINIEVQKNAMSVQNLIVDAAMTGIPECVKAESHDINFDGYPDFMVPTDDGSGGTSYTYWLYSTSTQQFYCPESNNDCSLMNPTFNTASKTVTSIDPMGAGSKNVKIYGIVDGRLVLISSVNNNY